MEGKQKTPSNGAGRGGAEFLRHDDAALRVQLLLERREKHAAQPLGPLPDAAPIARADRIRVTTGCMGRMATNGIGLTMAIELATTMTLNSQYFARTYKSMSQA